MPPIGLAAAFASRRARRLVSFLSGLAQSSSPASFAAIQTCSRTFSVPTSAPNGLRLHKEGNSLQPPRSETLPHKDPALMAALHDPELWEESLDAEEISMGRRDADVAVDILGQQSDDMMEKMSQTMEKLQRLVDEDEAHMEGAMLATALTLQLFRVKYPNSSLRRPKICDLPPKAQKVEALLNLELPKLRQAIECSQNVGEAIGVVLESELCASTVEQEKSRYRYLCELEVEDVFLHLQQFEDDGKIFLLEDKADSEWVLSILRAAKSSSKSSFFGEARLLNLTKKLLVIYKEELGLSHDASWERSRPRCKEFLRVLFDTNRLIVDGPEELAIELDRFERMAKLSKFSRDKRLDTLTVIEDQFIKCKETGVVTADMEQDEKYGDCYAILDNAGRIITKWKEHKEGRHRR